MAPIKTASDVLTAKVGDLREALSCRGLSSKGTKALLQERLLEVIQVGGAASSGGQKRKREDDPADDLRTQLECPVCFELITPPIFQCTAGHLICQVCRDQMPSPKKCPTCRQVSALSNRNLAMEKAAKGLVVACAHDGCSEMPKYDEYKSHVAKCDYRDIACIHRSCDFTGSPGALRAHFKDGAHSGNGTVMSGPGQGAGTVMNRTDRHRCVNDGQIRNSWGWNTYHISAGNPHARVPDAPDFVTITHLDKERGLEMAVFFVGPQKEAFHWSVQCNCRNAYANWHAKPVSIHEYNKKGRTKRERLGAAADIAFTLDNHQVLAGHVDGILACHTQIHKGALSFPQIR